MTTKSEETNFSCKSLQIKTTSEKTSNIKGAPSDLRQFLAAERPLKLMRNDFYFTSKALFVLKKDKFNFKIYDITTWLTNNCKTQYCPVYQEVKASDNEIWSVNRL